MPTRNATASWEGGQKGKGSFTGESGTIGGSYSFGSRFAEEKGTTPEELLAAAEAACYSMALGLALEQAGAKPTKVETRAACTVEKQAQGGFKITTMKLVTRVTAQDIDDAKLQQVAQATKAGCPVSVALAGVQIDVQATLERQAASV